MKFKIPIIQNKLIQNFISIILLFLSCFFIFIHSYDLLTLSDWETPLGYQGDMWLVLSLIKGYMDGTTLPFLFKIIPNLNAPFNANWNDYPITEEIIFYTTGIIARFVGLYPATSILLFLSHFLSLVSFYYVARYFKINLFLAISGAFIFAFSHFIFLRGIGHIVVGFVFHIPLIIMVLSWCYQQKIMKSTIWNKKSYIAIIIAFITGMFNPYYSIMFCQLLLFSVIYYFINKKYTYIKLPLTLILSTTFSFLLMNLDTMIYGIIHGTNIAFSHRNIPSLEIYALKLPDLIFPSGYTHLWGKISEVLYHSRTFLKGEYWSPYLGIVGILAFLYFIFSNLYFLFQKKFNKANVHFWHLIWIVLFSIVGGINLIIGSFGFTLLRATNRYSVMIFVIVLLYFFIFISKRFSQKSIIFISIILFSISSYEELYPRFKWHKSDLNPISEKIIDDQRIIWSIENYDEKAMVFQLPITDFPEVGPLFKMGDYENLRPYLNSNSLHFSHGSNKGRGDNDWQKQIALMDSKEMLSSLLGYGFKFIILNKNGYEDNGSLMLDKLKNYTETLYETTDLVSLKINDLTFEKIKPIINFSHGWSSDEVTHRWAVLKDAEISIHNFSQYERNINIEFDITSLRKSQIDIYFSDEFISTMNSQPGDFKNFNYKFILKPGLNKIKFKGNKYPILAGKSDRRLLSFALYNLNIDIDD